MNILMNILINNFSTLTLFSGINRIFLFFDSIVYSILEGIISIFFIIAKLDLQWLYTRFEGITKSISTLIGIFVLFKISFMLLEYLMEPDKATAKGSGSGKLIQDVLIAIVLFVLFQSNILFGTFHDIQVILLGGTGGSSDTSSFQVFDKLGIKAPTTNIIQNIIWGNDENIPTNVEHSITVKLMSTFLFHYTKTTDGEIVPQSWETNPGGCTDSLLSTWSSRCTLYNIAKGVEQGGTSWLLLGNADNIFISDLRYFAIISTAVGIYMIIMFAKSGVALFVRSLKLIVLQLIAPLAIVSYIDQKSKKLWNDYWKLYFQIYLDLFIRLVTIYISVYGIYIVMRDLDLTNYNLGFTSNIILKIMFIFAIFQFMKDFPQLIQSLFGIKVGDGAEFKKVLGGTFGSAIGGASGMIGGALSGAGVAGSLLAGAKGAWGGAKSGSSAQNIGALVSGQIQNASSSAEFGAQYGLDRSDSNSNAFLNGVNSIFGTSFGQKRAAAEAAESQKAKAAAQADADRKANAQEMARAMGIQPNASVPSGESSTPLTGNTSTSGYSQRPSGIYTPNAGTSSPRASSSTINPTSMPNSPSPISTPPSSNTNSSPVSANPPLGGTPSLENSQPPAQTIPKVEQSKGTEWVNNRIDDYNRANDNYQELNDKYGEYDNRTIEAKKTLDEFTKKSEEK